MVQYEGRDVRVGAFPISIDTAELTSAGRRSGRAGARHASCAPSSATRSVVLLGVDRLDYTKGIDRSGCARSPSCSPKERSARREHVMVQIAVPSREADAHYQREREHLEQLVGEVNGEHARSDGLPIHYLHQSVRPTNSSRLYLAADVMLVTPLRDGMNLVAKEYVACRVDGDRHPRSQ